MPSTVSTSYTRVAVWLHWIIALMIIGQIIGGKYMMAMDAGASKYELFQLHKSFGMIILILSIVRLLWRITHRAPALPAGMSAFERLGAKASHIGFYVLMIGTPLAGWIMVSAATPSITTRIFKTITVPDFPGVPRDETFAAFMENTHEFLATAIILLLAVHVGAALKHHFVNKDDILTRMIPFLKPKG